MYAYYLSFQCNKEIHKQQVRENLHLSSLTCFQMESQRTGDTAV